MRTLQRHLEMYRPSFSHLHIRSLLPHEANCCVVTLSQSPASNNISKHGTPVIVLVKKVMFKVSDDSLISTGLSDILSIQSKKTNQTKKQNQTEKKTKRHPYVFCAFGNQGTYLTANCKHPHLKIQVITR